MVLFCKLKGELEVAETQISESYEFYTFGKLWRAMQGTSETWRYDSIPEQWDKC